MKRFFLFAICVLTYTVTRAQGVTDTHPDAQILAIDYQSGQEYPANSDQAILFKDAFIDLVRNTYQSRQTLRMSPGRKTAIIKQINPQKLNGYQLTWETTMFGQTRAVATFYYNIDENSLYFFDQGAQSWVGVQISPENQYNLDNCRATCRFNSQQGLPDLASNGGLPDLSSLPDTTGQGIDEEVTTNEAPPALPEYDQPECPADGYMWQPGYWAFSPIARDYYWVPGVWVAPPAVGVYWTPGYWAFFGGIYRFHVGYWGHSVGFYGGINYGYGYVGVGYVGGEWRSDHFAYNTAVVHVNRVVVHNTYVNNTVINNTTIINNNRTSFNGTGGVVARPTATEQVAMHQQHIMPTHDQIVHQQAALGNRGQFASDNHGAPTVTTMAKVQPAALNKGNGPAVNPNNRNFSGHQQGNNNAPNGNAFGQGNRNMNNGHQPANNNAPNQSGFSQGNNGHQPAANNGQPNNNNGFRNPNSNQQPANNGVTPVERNQNTNQQPASGHQGNNEFNSNNRNMNNNQQPANNGQQNNEFRNSGNNPQQPANNGQQNNGVNRDNHNIQNNPQQPANSGHQNNGFGNFNNNQRPATNSTPANNGNNQPNRNQNNGQQQPVNNQQQNNNRFNPGNQNQNNKPANNSGHVKVQRQQKPEKDDK